jgi:hypothetical protein
MVQSISNDRFGGKALAEALSIAWKLLIAADHPITQSSSADDVRKRMADRIKLRALTAIDDDDLWLAALNEVQFEPRSAKSPTALLATIWEMGEAA